MTSSRPPADSVAPHYTALQLAWLQELGVEKPWLPAAPAVSAPRHSQPQSNKREKPGAEAVRVQAVLAQALPAQAAPVQAAPIVQVDTAALAAAAQDLDALGVMLSACQACGLCRDRKQAVSGEGVTQPAIMVIGDAPGELDDRSGKPFSDRMGLMLDNMLSSIQSGRTHNAYLTNVVKCRPPGNRNPKPDELAACKPYLLRQIELVKPYVIVAVGRVSAQALLGSNETVQNLRQKTHTLTVGDLKIPLIVSEHPVRLLGHPADKAAAWQDLQLVRTVAGL
jgi:uracil-DNA glycosylase